MKRSILAILLVLTLPLAAIEKAKSKSTKVATPNTEMSQGREGNSLGIFRELNLTADQKEQLKEMKDGQKAVMKDNRDEIKALQKSLQDKLKGDTPDAELTALFNQIHDKKTNTMRDSFNQMLKVRAILTPAQRTKYYELREKRSGMGKGRGKGMGMGNSSEL